MLCSTNGNSMTVIIWVAFFPCFTNWSMCTRLTFLAKTSWTVSVFFMFTVRFVERVAELIYSQEDNTGSSKSPRDIQKLTGIPRSSVRRIAKRDMELHVFRRKKAHLLSDSDREKRVKCCKTLLRGKCLQTETVTAFKSRLKTHLFKLSYCT